MHCYAPDSNGSCEASSGEIITILLFSVTPPTYIHYEYFLEILLTITVMRPSEHAARFWWVGSSDSKKTDSSSGTRKEVTWFDRKERKHLIEN